MKNDKDATEQSLITSVPELITFLKHFHRRWMERPELDPSLVPPDLPEGLALLYRELGAMIGMEPEMEFDGKMPFASQDALVPLDSLKRDGDWITFAWENQGNWSCRCRVNESDPPVYSDAPDIWDGQESGFQLICDSLNHFLITLCLHEALFSCRYLIAVNDNIQAEHVTKAELVPLWLRGRYVYLEPSHNFYFVPDREAIIMDYSGPWIGSPAASVLDMLVPGIKYTCLDTGNPIITSRISGAP